MYYYVCWTLNSQAIHYFLVGQNCNLLSGNKSFENAAKSKYLGATVAKSELHSQRN
jgi:hypothetical protein